jgi:hypothetical protein
MVWNDTRSPGQILKSAEWNALIAQITALGVSGVALSVSDGGTIAHGLSTTPTWVTCTPSVAGEFVSVTAIGAANFTVAIKAHNGAPGTTQTIYWRAG